MIRIAIKHYLLDKAIRVGFDRLISNFTSISNLILRTGNRYSMLTYTDFCSDGTEFKVTCTNIYEFTVSGEYCEFRSTKSYFQFDSTKDMNQFLEDYFYDSSKIVFESSGCNFTCMQDIYTGILVSEILEIK